MCACVYVCARMVYKNIFIRRLVSLKEDFRIFRNVRTRDIVRTEWLTWRCILKYSCFSYSGEKCISGISCMSGRKIKSTNHSRRHTIYSLHIFPEHKKQQRYLSESQINKCIHSVDFFHLYFSDWHLLLIITSKCTLYTILLDKQPSRKPHVRNLW